MSQSNLSHNLGNKKLQYTYCPISQEVKGILSVNRIYYEKLS